MLRQERGSMTAPTSGKPWNGRGPPQHDAVGRWKERQAGLATRIAPHHQGEGDNPIALECLISVACKLAGLLEYSSNRTLRGRSRIQAAEALPAADPRACR
jgi:hypothetical protein